MRRSARSGFTLIEILIVVGIIGILVVVLLAALLMARKKGDVAEAKNFVAKAVPTAMTMWQELNNKSDNDYPASPELADGDNYVRGNIELYKELILDPKDKGKDPFIPENQYREGEENGKPVFLDKWNNFYIYRNYTMKKSASGKNRPFTGKRYNENTYDIISKGPDGELYTDDDIYNGKPD